MSKEKPTVKQCKHCKSEIPYDAKVCPVCRKKQGAPGCLIVVLVVVVLMVIAALAGGGESNTPQKVESTSGTSQAASQSSEAQPEQTVFTVTCAIWTVTGWCGSGTRVRDISGAAGCRDTRLCILEKKSMIRTDITGLIIGFPGIMNLWYEFYTKIK